MSPDSPLMHARNLLSRLIECSTTDEPEDIEQAIPQEVLQDGGSDKLRKLLLSLAAQYRCRENLGGELRNRLWVCYVSDPKLFKIETHPDRVQQQVLLTAVVDKVSCAKEDDPTVLPELKLNSKDLMLLGCSFLVQIAKSARISHGERSGIYEATVSKLNETFSKTGGGPERAAKFMELNPFQAASKRSLAKLLSWAGIAHQG